MGTHTDLIHRGERPASGGSTALTTPIYETATFVFDSARDVERYQDGSLSRLSLLALRESHDRGGRREDGGDRWRRDVAGLQLRHGGNLHRDVVAAQGRRRGRVRVGDLWRDLSPDRASAARASASRGGSCRSSSSPHPASVIGPKTKLVWFESPINPTLRCVDIRAVAGACRAAGVLSGIDNTFASPINQQPLALGIDLSMQSATKYLNGHSDVTGGVLSGIAGAAGAHRQDAAAARRRHGSAARVCA